MTITPTLARGLRRGSERRLNGQSEAHFLRGFAELERAPYRHGPWFRRALALVENDPASMVLRAVQRGEKKHLRWQGLVLAMDREHNWRAHYVRIETRTRRLESRFSGFSLSQHAIERAMQWWKIDHVLKAIQAVSTGVYVGCLRQMGFDDAVLENLDLGTKGDDWLLGFPGGALVATPDRNNEDAWIATTTLRDFDHWKGEDVQSIKITVRDNDFTRGAFQL